MPDNQTNDAGANVVFREDVFLFPGCGFPDALGTYLVLAGFDPDQQIIIGGTGKFPFVLGQLLGHFLHHGHFKAIGLALVVDKVIGYIVVGEGHIHHFLFVAAACSRLIVTFAAACQACCQNARQSCRQNDFAEFFQIHLLYSPF